MSTSICWELTWNGLMSHPGGVKDSHPLKTTETGNKHLLHRPHASNLFLKPNVKNYNTIAQTLKQIVQIMKKGF